jgi:alpha-galactosidase
MIAINGTPRLIRRMSAFSPRVLSRLALLLLSVFAISPTLRADDVPALNAWKNGPLPFSFTYDGKKSSDFLSGWKRTDETLPSENGETHRYTFTDPTTSLKLVADVRTFTDFPAIDWVLHFTNEGQKDTPIIEDVKPLDWKRRYGGMPPPITVLWAQGSNAAPDDFAPHTTPIEIDKPVTLNSTGGRSSNNNLPFFYLDSGSNPQSDEGMFGAIGWTGNWVAHFAQYPNPSGRESVAIDAGMQRTHFVLHSGETVRTPRIVLLDWKGDRTNAQNRWRKFVLAHYSPRQPDGSIVTMPISLGTWGAEAVADRIKTIDALKRNQVPIDVYWMDAGWYGSNGDWPHQRGNWTPNPAYFPPADNQPLGGLRQLGGYAFGNGMAFLIWLEAETADPGSDLLKNHPDWYLQKDGPNTQGLLNFGNPAALSGMTEILSNLITHCFIAWYRQDFNVEPDGYWAKNDAPDRIGVTEMEDIAGLYDYWDALRRAHPGLQIDNCASGGRRLDLETMSRSVSLWRSDHCCSPYDPIANQSITQGLNGWVPLNAGDIGPFGGPTPADVSAADLAPATGAPDAAATYMDRSAYSAGLVFGSGRPPIPMIKAAAQEFHDIRANFIGDFYPLTPYDRDPAKWCVMQWDRPDLKSGIVLYFRRPNCNDTSTQVPLKAIDLNAQYDVEIRSGFAPAQPQMMSGRDLMNLTLTVSDKPGATLVLYKQK